MSFMEFLDMGGYAGFVWPAYLITAVVLIANLLLPRIRHRGQRKSITARVQKDPSTGG
jgi:heme exporter protein D